MQTQAFFFFFFGLVTLHFKTNTHSNLCMYLNDSCDHITDLANVNTADLVDGGVTIQDDLLYRNVVLNGNNDGVVPKAKFIFVWKRVESPIGGFDIQIAHHVQFIRFNDGMPFDCCLVKPYSFVLQL